MALTFQLADLFLLILRQYFCHDLRDTQLLSYSFCSTAVVSGQHDDFDTHFLPGANSFIRSGLNSIRHADDS